MVNFGNTEYLKSQFHGSATAHIVTGWAKPKAGKRETIFYFDFIRLTTSAYVKLALPFTKECIIPAA
jgi:hypothetical protein